MIRTHCLVVTIALASLGCQSPSIEGAQTPATKPETTASAPKISGLVGAFAADDVDRVESILGMKPTKMERGPSGKFQRYMTQHLVNDGIVQVDLFISKRVLLEMTVIFDQSTNSHAGALAKLGIDAAGAKVHTVRPANPITYISGIKADGVMLADFNIPSSPLDGVKFTTAGPQMRFFPKGDQINRWKEDPTYGSPQLTISKDEVSK